jgi:hypothetical protein
LDIVNRQICLIINGSPKSTMSTRNKFVLLTLALAGLLGISWITVNYPLIRYAPIVLGVRQELVAAPQMRTKQHLDRVEQVLTYYGQPYRRAGATDLRISLTLIADKELVWNYTTKAEDTDWLATHQGHIEDAEP